MNSIEVLKGNIINYFQNDSEQLGILKSNDKRIIIEAPPGYGKTKVLISKTVYDLLNYTPKNHEKVLMITYSNNSASNMKKDLYEEIIDYPDVLKSQIRTKTLVTNFHGFARRVLSKYGTLLNPLLENISEFTMVNESDLKGVHNSHILHKFQTMVNDALEGDIFNNLSEYNKVVLNEVLPLKKLTYNSILTLTIQLLQENNHLLSLYRKLYTKLVIDEFQDTNHLNLKLIELFLNEDLDIELYGDPLQRIYGFIGTVENVFDIFGEKHKFKSYNLQTNYRFQNNKGLLNLEKRIRDFATAPAQARTNLNKLTSQKIIIYDNHVQEILTTVDKVNKIVENSPDKKIAILTAMRGPDINLLLTKLDENNLSHFDALPIDSNSVEYKAFCSICAKLFQKYFSVERKIVKEELNNWVKILKSSLKELSNQQNSLLKLLYAFLADIVSDDYYRRMSQEEKHEFILNVFLEESLHNYLSSINEPIQVLTIHTSKGLEWDEVFLLDVEKGKLPNHFAICQACEFNLTCHLDLNHDNEKFFLEQLSVFYVAVTRAKENLHISASNRDAYSRDNNLSCIFYQLKIEPTLYVLT